MKYDLDNKEEIDIGEEHGEGLVKVDRSKGNEDYEAVSILICKPDRFYDNQFYHDKLNEEVTFLQRLFLLVVCKN